MATDLSIWQNANKPTVAMVDPTAQLGQMANTQNALNQNRLFQSQGAVGQAYQNATGPDGTLDVNKLRQNIANDPNAALGAQEANASAQSLNVSQQGVALKNLQAQSTALGSLQALNDGAGPTYGQMVGKLQEGLTQGWLQQHGAAAVLMGMPSGDDPQSMATRQHMVQTMDSQNASSMDRLTATMGKPDEKSNGQDLQPGLTGGPMTPNYGVFGAKGAPIPVYPPRAQIASQVSGTDAKGNQTSETQADRLLREGRGDLAGPAGQPPSSMGTGRLPTALLNPNRRADPNAAGGQTPPGLSALQPMDAPTQTPGSPLVTGIGPAQIASQSASGAASSAAFADIKNQGDTASAQNAQLGNMLSDAAQFTSGMTKANDFKAFVTKQAPAISRAFGVNQDAVTANQSFDKLANQIALSQGAGSDGRLGVAQHGNPNSTLTAPAVDLMLRQLQGNADFIRGKAQMAANYPDQSDANGFSASVRQNLDPRAFQIDRMTAPQQQVYIKNLSPTDRPIVQNAHAFAQKNGLLASQNVQQ